MSFRPAGEIWPGAEDDSFVDVTIRPGLTCTRKVLFPGSGLSPFTFTPFTFFYLPLSPADSSPKIGEQVWRLKLREMKIIFLPDQILYQALFETLEHFSITPPLFSARLLT